MARARKRKAASSTVPEEQQKQQQERESAWKKVDVSLPSDDGFGSTDAAKATKTKTDSTNTNTNSTTNEDDKESEYSTKNHYDDPTMGRTKFARNDLEAAPGEDVAIFSGLQVIQGSDYHMETTSDGQSLFRILTDSEKKKAKGAKAAKPAATAATATAFKKTPAATATAPAAAATVDNEVVKVSKKRKKPKDAKAETPMEEDAEEATSKPAFIPDSATTIDPATALTAEDPDTSTPTTTKKKKKRRKQKKKPKNDSANTNSEKEQEETEDDPVQIQALQMSWTTATAGCQLHPVLAAALLQQSFWTPTPIQAAVLPAAILGRRNIVGAAPTGSGKTLAFLLPICQYLLEQRDEHANRIGNGNDNDNDADDNDADDTDTLPHNHNKIQALIVTPTRELAMQIHAEAAKLLGSGAGRSSDITNTKTASVNHHLTGLIVGGLAHAKQQRVLEKSRPPIIVATPGRLWELISSGEHEHLNDLSQIRFLVIDEADRMVSQGSFKELGRILDAVQAANPMDADDDEDEDDAVSDNGDDEDAEAERMFGLPGVPGEARVEMLSDDVMKKMQQQHGDDDGDDENDSDDDENDEPVAKEMEDDEYEALTNGQQGEDDDDSDADFSLPALPPVERQTFVYSATLTLPSPTPFIKGKGKPKKKKTEEDKIDGAIAEILDKARAKGKTKIVDLTNAEKSGKAIAFAGDKKVAAVRQIRLPPGLELQAIKCTQLHKDSHLYAYLMTTAQGASGPCLVFCNSIAAVRRVGTTLETLGLPVRILHAQMQQRQRLKAVESLKDPKKGRTIVVATDVAARGLDIPSVATVVHYDAARNVDGFVHRAGRTARGIGEKAVGLSLSLVAPSEDKIHAKLSQSLEAEFSDVVMDSRLLHSAQERVNLASKVVSTNDTEQKTNRENEWFRKKAEEAGLEMDDNLLDEGLAGGDLRDQSRLREAQKGRIKLRQLLSEPMQTQKYGKFLSTNTAARQNAVVPPVLGPSPYASQEPKKKPKRRKKG